MKIDSVSTKLVTLALYLDEKRPGSVSEIWLDESIVEQLKADAMLIASPDEYIEIVSKEIKDISDNRRRQYLLEMLNSIAYQLNPKIWKNIDLLDFTKNCFGIAIPNIDDSQIEKLDKEIGELERRIGKDREAVFKGLKIPVKELEVLFAKNLEKARNNVDKVLGIKPNQESFKLILVTGESWSAFNKHIKPYESELLINTDQSVTKRDLEYLAYHEGFGGHHSELSFKDKLLLEEGRGEHGLVITYSPQTFISEAIAVNSETWFSNSEKDLETKLCDLYGEFAGGILLIKVAYMYHQEKKTKEEINTYLNMLNITDESRDSILGFCTDQTYGVYTMVYYFAEKFLYEKWLKAEDKASFLKDIYTKPMTPSML